MSLYHLACMPSYALYFLCELAIQKFPFFISKSFYFTCLGFFFSEAYTYYVRAHLLRSVIPNEACSRLACINVLWELDYYYGNDDVKKLVIAFSVSEGCVQ